MTTRAPGYYWLRAADGSAFIARLMPDAKLWMTAGDDVVVVDIDVLAGPLQAPSDSAQYRAGMRHAIDDLRARARALLEGTTPGPWIDVGRDSIEAGNGSTVVDCYLSADTRFVLGAHALLTELAKEES